MRSRLRRKYRSIRKEFKEDLYKIARNNSAVGILIVETYVARQQRTHIGEIWRLMQDYPAFKKAYKERLSGKSMCGEDEILRSMYFVDEMFYKKYIMKMPRDVAMGDALAIAYRIQRESKSKAECKS